MNFISPHQISETEDCPLLVISDSDWRFRKADQEFVEHDLAYTEFDFYSWPNTIKGILRQNGFKKELVEKIVSVARGLHNIKKILLLSHHLEESEDFVKNLLAARDILAKELPDNLEIILAYSKNSPQGLEYKIVE
ncbi:hypothetical protein H6761_00270 [Candidatus Nomurabacteria bacterium]|nr:hypothetical protein [Candidatus Nomurabacteria bacterium]